MLPVNSSDILQFTTPSGHRRSEYAVAPLFERFDGEL